MVFKCKGKSSFSLFRPRSDENNQYWSLHDRSPPWPLLVAKHTLAPAGGGGGVQTLVSL